MAGDVIHYAFLWPDHADLGRETDKDRPCGVVLSAPHGADLIVFVVPLTTKDPHDQRAIELPEGGELGLKSRSWIIPWELNTFQWRHRTSATPRRRRARSGGMDNSAGRSASA